MVRTTISSFPRARRTGSLPPSRRVWSSTNRAATSRFPRKFRNEYGQLEEHAPYYERDFRAPVLREPIDAQGEYEIRVTNAGAKCPLRRAEPPLRSGRAGTATAIPYAFNADEFAPVTGKLHQPPTSHATFEAPGAAFCVFVPRLFDYHPLAIPVPYNHSSVDCDEVLYYVSGNFMSRRGIGEGSITLHAAGAPHGPQPGAVERQFGQDLDRRTCDHGRHLPTAAHRAARTRARRSGILPVLDRSRGRRRAMIFGTGNHSGSSFLAIISASLTPAILILATGSLVASTLLRLDPHHRSRARR